MRPEKFFEAFLNWNVWTFGFGIDFQYHKAFVAFGPVGAEINWRA
jgi:hypothetical protein